VDLLHDVSDARSSFDAEPADTRDIGAIDMDPFAHRNEVYRTSAPLSWTFLLGRLSIMNTDVPAAAIICTALNRLKNLRSSKMNSGSVAKLGRTPGLGNRGNLLSTPSVAPRRIDPARTP
jgi:hypothetical protein